jgi:molecular chaperone DnaJ
MDPYDILGIPSNATPDEIRKAYYTLVKQYHPDKNPSDEATERVRLINAAYEIVSDPIRRAQYQRPADVSIAYEEDPIEAYKREFKRKRWEKEQ